MEDGALADTLGDEARGMVVVDFDGHPQKFDQMEILSQFVAKEVNVLKVDVPRAGGKGWKRTNSEIETQDTDLGNKKKRGGFHGCQVRSRGDLGEGQ